MSFPRYPRYKDSGVEWLGEVPEHWTVTALKHDYEVTLGKMLQPERRSSDDELLPYLRAANIQWDGVDTTDVKQMWFSPRESAELVVRPGDLLVSEGGDVGRSCVFTSEGEAYRFQNSVNRVRSKKGDSTRFLYYWMATIKAKGFVDVLCNKSTIAHFTAEKVAAVPVPLPPRGEQAAIVEFLDHETTSIDVLIAEQQCLIELLKEKRQAVISSAVIPRVDERTTKLRHLIEVTPGFAFPSDGFSEYGEGHRLLRGVNVGVGACRWHETVYWAQGVDARITEYQLKVGDLVLGMDRPWINEGTRIARIESSDLPALLVQRVARIRAKAGSSLEYIRIVLASQAFQSYLEADLTGVSVPHISERQIVSFPVRALSFDDQVRIAATTMSSMSGIDNLIAESQRAIALLQERRTALISAAVTGKIDVRGLAMAEAA